MPTNLNALIRYKTIDTCLRNKYRPSTIEMLREACTEALAESRGIGKKISERTIRDDIRIMRSDILGFNAPIIFEGGYYLYSDPGYSIFNTTINHFELMNEIFQLMVGAHHLISDDKKEVWIKILSDLSGITGKKIPDVIFDRISSLGNSNETISDIPKKVEIPKRLADRSNQMSADKKSLNNDSACFDEKGTIRVFQRTYVEQSRNQTFIQWADVYRIIG